MPNYQYAYLIGDLILLPIWLYLFFARKDLRKELLLTSLLFGIISPISDYVYIKDYWQPETFLKLFRYHGIYEPLIEDFLFGFLIGGISSTIYEELWGKRFANRKNRQHNWIWFIPSLSGGLLAFLFVSIKYLNINSMHASAIGFLICALVMILYRRDLWRDAFYSGFITALIMFLGYLFFLKLYPLAILKWWLLKNVTGILIVGVPIEELLWGFSLGLLVGPLYEFFKGYKLTNISS